MAILRNSLNTSLRTVLLSGLLLIFSSPDVLAHTDVTVEQARDLIDSTNDLIIVDVREESEYCDARGHIPGALNYPWNSGQLESRYEELPKDDPILLVCRSGGRSNQAANFLDSKGFSMVYDMMGGMSAWIWETEPCKQSNGNEAASAETNTYIFLSDQSTLLQTGGIAGVNWNYSVRGHFRLAVDEDSGTGSFTLVDANAIDDSPFDRTLDPNEVFNMNSLLGMVLDETTISFTGIASDGSNIDITATFQDNLVHLVGQTTPPANSADFFIFNLDAVAQRKYGGGTGEPNNPYQIATAEDLMLLGDSPEDYDKHFILTADIDLDPNFPGRKVFGRAVVSPDTNDIEGGFQGTPFTGIFDGMGYKIRKLTIRNNTSEYVGLFGYLDPSGQIQNLSLKNVSITGSDRIGGLAGYSSGTIINCYTTGSIFSQNGIGSLGGLVGINRGGIRDCHANIDIKGGDSSWRLGGLVGSCSWGSIRDSHATGNVSSGDGSWCIGGLAGENWYGEISNSYATGNVEGGNGSHSLGGLMGRIEYGKVIKCYAAGSVTIEDSGRTLGGLVGSCLTGIITDCYATGSVSGNWELGGLVGSLLIGSKITNCYAVGRVSSSTNSANSGGLIGTIGREYIWVNGCLWDIETSSLSRSAAGIGLATAKMQDVGTYQNAGWDFTGYSTDGTSDIWWMPKCGGYPELTIFSEVYQTHTLAGSGTPEDPYQIATAEDLGALCQYDRSRYYKLINDIDLAGITWATAPIPDFYGSFEGNGHRIKNLSIKGSTTDFCLGLFGDILSNGWIQNLGLENVSITAGDGSFRIGGLAGSNSGKIINCYVTGNISMPEESSDIGGLVGFNHGDITYCYTICNISNGYNSKRVGGLVGNNYYRITQCFASGLMVSEGDSTELGGLVGFSAQPDYLINSCFWDIETSRLSQSDGGIGLTTAQMQDLNIFMDAGWDFVDETANGTEDIWWILEGQDYPRLWWELIPEN
jgi:rhodanese-related sulfurtransferase